MWSPRHHSKHSHRRSYEQHPYPDEAYVQLQKEVELLRTHNEQLQQQLAAAGAVAGEYLYRWRTVGLPLIGPEWELRYFMLQGTNIRYYKSSKDVIFSPREEFSILGCTVEWQGLQGTRLWVWALVDPGGRLLVRVGSPSEQSAQKWCKALQQAGCIRRLAGRPGGGQHFPHSISMSSIDSSISCLDALPAPLPGTPTRIDELQLNPLTLGIKRPFSHSGSASSPPGSHHTLHEPAAKKLDKKPSQSRKHQEPAAPAADAADAAGASSAAKQPEADGEGSGSSRRQAMLASTPVHTSSRYSYLSSERMWHEKHTGLYNLMAVILVATNFRLALENAMKYGWRYNPVKGLRDLTIANPNIPVALCYPVLVLLALLALLSEVLAYKLMQNELQLESALDKKGVAPKAAAKQLAARRKVHEAVLLVINILITCATIAVPWTAISATKAEPIAGGVLIGLSITIWMKLVSFHHCCADLRNARRAGEVRPGERGSPATPVEWALLAYPENLTPSHLAYFLAAPTLSYQVNYPRSGPIRMRWLARRVGELVVMLTVLSLIYTQYMEPAIANSMKPMRQMDFLHVCERLLKLALPNTYCWLVMFYCLFHLWLNILAELLCFGDREFYKDWWNAPTLGDYWRLWNMPVHKWLLRHVYFPAVRMGLSRLPAMVLVFFVSAVFHELMMGVPLHCVRLWAFTGIMLQVPMIMFTDHVRKRLKRDEAGNYVFWLTFCVVGQPLSILLYAHDFMYQVRPHMNIAATGTA